MLQQESAQQHGMVHRTENSIAVKRHVMSVLS